MTMYNWCKILTECTALCHSLSALQWFKKVQGGSLWLNHCIALCQLLVCVCVSQCVCVCVCVCMCESLEHNIANICILIYKELKLHLTSSLFVEVSYTRVLYAV